ncbi:MULTISPECIES: hypothetical protein [Vibrio harveyi group]|uniref:hypothetical protein n=1 Tax=Vibrio harveyi group TaxID=717610 RepID=UPI00280DC1A9|nr:hypothetical protein [Vibrio alginolyticus]
MNDLLEDKPVVVAKDHLGEFKRKVVVVIKNTCGFLKKYWKLSILSQLSQILTALVAMFTVVVAICQIKSAEHQAQQQLAKTMYEAYLELAFEHPHFAEPSLFSLCSHIDIKKIYEFEKCESQYEWFVSRAFYAAENILALNLSDEDKKSWEDTIEVQVRNHSEYLMTESFSTSINTYSCNLLPILGKHGADKEIVAAVYKENCAE